MKTFANAGRLGNDPELKTKDEKPYVRLRIAANGKTTDWFTVAVFGPLAEAAAQHLKKGDGVAVSGRLQSSTYKDRPQIDFIGNNADFFAKK